MIGCDDPVPGEIGGIILTIESIESEPDGKGAEIESLEVHYDRVEAIHRNEPDSESRPVVLDTQDRDILMFNRPERESLVAQFQVPVGYVEQIRIFPTAVFVHLEDGTTEELEPGTPALPSWEQTGWKITHHEDGLFEIEEDELTGVRGLLDFDDRFVAPPGSSGGQGQGQGSDTAQAATGWKVKPTLPAEEWQVNPEPWEPGVYADQLTLVFHDHVERDRIDELNDEIDASVILNLPGSQWYRVKLPASINFEEAFEYYDQFRDDIIAIMPGINLGPEQVIPEEIEPAPENYEMVNFPEAWELAIDHDPRGFVGSHEITVAVHDSGLDLTHPDIYRNVKLNQENLPRGLFDIDGDGEPNIEDFDCDPPADEDLGLEAGNGMITFRDLECEENEELWIDGEPPTPADILGSADWSEGLEDPRVDHLEGDFVNELVGWDFFNHTNDPSHHPTNPNPHGTRVAGLVGAQEGTVDDDGEPIGILGASWRVSILPIQGRISQPIGDEGPTPEFAVPHETFARSLQLADARGVDVLNVSQGLTVESEDIDDRMCGHKDGNNVVAGIPVDVMEEGIQEAIAAYDALLEDSTDMLIVVSGGNDGYNVDVEDVIRLPHTPFSQSEHFQDRILKVGALESFESRAQDFANYGSDSVDIYAPGTDWRVLMPPHPEHGSWPHNCEGDRPYVCDRAEGSSFSAPLVAGLAALLMSINDELRSNPVAVRDLILDTAAFSGTVEECMDEVSGARVLDAAEAVREVLP